MSKRVLVLVEGPTEENFVKKLLVPYFSPMEIYLFPTILVTKRVLGGPNFKGGVSKFHKIENDLKILLHSNKNALVTTILDYYGLPEDSPGMDNRPVNASALNRVVHVEDEFENYFGSPTNLHVFLVLHEFEALLFSSSDELPRVMTEPEKQNQIAEILNQFDCPEDINDRPEYAPSKRIKKLFPAYRKTLHGPLVARRIGLDTIRAKCPHFNAWMEYLEDFAEV